MAKLNAPLFSFSASGSIAKALVYFPWKGLNVVRSWVSPANPKSPAQMTIRDRLKAAVAKIHFYQASVSMPFGVNDATSYALLGSLEATPRTWFNTIVRQWLKQKVAGKIPAVFTKGSCTPGASKLTLSLIAGVESSAITDYTINYGTSKTNLASSIACTDAALIAGKDIPGLSPGTKYYCQARATLPTTFLGTRSGIWHGTPTV